MSPGRKPIFASLVSALLIFFTFSTAWGEELRILYVNDFHGFASGYKPLGSNEFRGGIARLAGLAERLRKERPSLFLAAGDMIQGDNFANLFQGKSVIEVINTMGFDAMTVGNHEFDFGPEVLRDRIEEARFPVLGANVRGLSLLKPYVIKEINGLRVAVIGVVTEETGVYARTEAMKGIAFTPHTTAVRAYVEELRNRVDIIIVLSHIGYPADLAVAKTIEGIDVIVGGHSHAKVEKPVMAGKTIVVQAWEHGKALGVLDLSVEHGKIVTASGSLEEIKPDMPESDTARSVVEKYRGKVNAVLNKVIGESETDLDGKHVRTEETNLGDLVADIIRNRSGADVAIANGGGIRTSIGKGPVRLGDVYAALPFDNYIVALKLTGSELKQVLEHGVSAVEKEEGRFPQVSGLTFAYSLSAPAGQRVRKVLVGGEPLDEFRTYSVATNDFLVAGGDGYTVFGDAIKKSGAFSMHRGILRGEAVLYSEPGRWIRDVVADYIRLRGVVSIEKDERIIETGPIND